MPVYGQIAGGYVTLFIAAPRAIDDVVTIAYPGVPLKNKGAAALDLGVMGGLMVAFAKFASKHPKIAAVGLGVATVDHLQSKISNGLKILEANRTGPVLYFANEKAYLKSKPSCTDGRRVVILNPKREVPSFSNPTNSISIIK